MNDRTIRQALEAAQDLLVAMLHETRERSEIEAQITENRAALVAPPASSARVEPAAETAQEALFNACMMRQISPLGTPKEVLDRIIDWEVAVNALPPIKAPAVDEWDTVPKWIYDALVETLTPAWDYVQTHQEQFNALPGDDKTKIIVDEFMKSALAANGAEQTHDASYCPGRFGKHPHVFNHQKCGYCGKVAR